MTQIILSRVAPGGAVTALAFLAVARRRSSHVRSGMADTVLAMEKPVQWMTLQELRDELERTRPAWGAMDVDGVLANGQLPVSDEDAHRHQLVANELFRRPGNG